MLVLRYARGGGRARSRNTGPPCGAHVSGPGYPAARIVAPQVADHFSRHLTAARGDGEIPLATPPDAVVVEAIVEAAFWASLRREEGHSPTVSLAFLPPEQSRRPLRFERPLPLATGPLLRLAPAVERSGIHLGFWRSGRELRIWGVTRTLPPFCFVLEVVGPGLLVVKHRGDRDAGKFVNVAVLEGDQVKIVDARRATLPDGASVACPLLGADPIDAGLDPAGVLLQLAVSIRAHGRGGSLLVVPPGSVSWRESILQAGPFAVAPSSSELGELMRRDPAEREQLSWRVAQRRAVDAVAGLTAVDGATIIDSHYDLLAFGAKLGRRDGRPPVQRVIVSEPVANAATAEIDSSELGGTRHLSAAQFVHDQHDAIGLVASQDGHFTVFAWSPERRMVHAHRIEILLL